MRSLNQVIGSMRGRMRERMIGRLVREHMDVAYYLDRYEDIRDALSNGSLNDPVRHYVAFGWREHRDPHPGFSTAFYLAANRDVAQAGINPYYHYLRFGRWEGRAPRPGSVVPMQRNGQAEWNAYDRLTALARDEGSGTALASVRLAAFYLPQFHPIPENDLAWGAGFTEWTNVRRAKANFKHHRQPRVPAELGYYDLRTPEVMDAQAKMAVAHGIDAFCYYYYWFDGKKLLELPLERLLATGQPRMPFCICWANENWTRRWDGGNSELIIAQRYSDENDRAVIADLARYLKSELYVRVDGRPLLLVYRVTEFPDFRKTADTWRDYCRRHGIGEIAIAYCETFELGVESPRPQELGCDYSVEFPTHQVYRMPELVVEAENPRWVGRAHDYESLVRHYVQRPLEHGRRFHGALVGWDNTARRQDDSTVLGNATPGAFRAWVEAAVRRAAAATTGGEQLIFINAWNEWSEGAYLEPDTDYGDLFLKAVQAARSALPPTT